MPKTAQSYQRLLRSVVAGSLNEGAPVELPPELQLQSLWFAGQFGREFTSTRGRQITIKQFGEWNRGAGPDFRNAAVTIDGELLSGPIELDPYPEDWDHHGHSKNPAYNSVCLHVTARPADSGEWFTRTADNRLVERVVLSTKQLQEALRTPRYATALAHPGRCATPLADAEPTAIHSLLESAARHRIQSKAQRIGRCIEAHGPDQTLYESIAEVLGYRPNQQNLRAFAQTLPLRLLTAHAQHAEAILFGTAGILTADLHARAPESSRDYLRNLWDRWWQVRDQFALDPERLPKWQFSGIRPINHPHRRLGTLAHLITRWSAFRSATHRALGSPSQFLKFCTTLEHPHWSHHYTLTSKTSAKPLSLLGKERAFDFLVNHLVPKFHLKGEPIWDLYAKIKAGPNNDAVKRATLRLFGHRSDQKNFTKFAWQQQGLIQIYQDFCLNDTSDCENCPFPEQLHQWVSKTTN